MPSTVMNPNKVHFLHATPGLRQQTPSIKSFPQTEKALKDLEGMTLIDKELLRYGYRTEEFGYYELMKMRRCKDCCVRIKSRAARSKAMLTPAEQTAEDARREARSVITRAKLKKILPHITYHACPPPRFEGYGAQVEADYLRINPEVAAMYGIDEERVAASFAYEAANPGQRMPWPEFEEEARLTWKQAADGSWYGDAGNSEVYDEEDDWETAQQRREPQEPPSKEKPTGTHFIVHHIIIDHSLDYTQTAHIEVPVEICHWDLFKGGIAKDGKKAICQSHSETPYYGIFPCCGERIGHPGCVQSNKHKSAWEYAYLAEDFKMFETQPGQAIDERRAIALDCEMGMNMRGESELIQVAAIDFFTGEVLLDSLVLPDVPMRHLATRYSGVTWQMLRKAENNGTCLRGRDDARNRLMKFVGPKTIIVAHDGKADLLALRWIHKWIVDTYETESRIGVVKPVEEKKNLMHLAKVHLQRDIQQGRGHDCLKDCLACRDLGVFYVKTLPDEVKVRDEPDPLEDRSDIW